MNRYVIVCKEKDNNKITMFSNLSFKQAERKLLNLKKEGATNIQLRIRTIGASSVLVV